MNSVKTFFNQKNFRHAQKIFLRELIIFLNFFFKNPNVFPTYLQKSWQSGTFPKRWPSRWKQGHSHLQVEVKTDWRRVHNWNFGEIGNDWFWQQEVISVDLFERDNYVCSGAPWAHNLFTFSLLSHLLRFMWTWTRTLGPP